MTDLSLETRTGLPDTLAYLRSSFSQQDWRKHANFGELSAFWLQVHEHLRGQGAALNQATASYREGSLDPARFRQFFAPALNQFLQHLNGHHQIEDRFYFPKFRTLDQRMVAGFDLLERDHELIHEALLATAESANFFLKTSGDAADAPTQAADAYASAADWLVALLTRHLADEEDLIVPAILQHGEQRVA
jgi:iron-sulfur cluster repair protein YtfE (RIC family)